MILASFEDYVPLDSLAKIVVVVLAIAVVAPIAAALVITGFEAQARAQARHASVVAADARIALGGLILVSLVVAGLVALVTA